MASQLVELLVPKSTLFDSINGRVSVDSTGPGPAPVLSQLEESLLTIFCICLALART